MELSVHELERHILFKDLMSPDGGSVFHRSSTALSLQSGEHSKFQYWEYAGI